MSTARNRLEEACDMNTIALPCKCKLCGKVIGHYSLEWPPPKDNAAMEAANQQQFGILCNALTRHLSEQAKHGMREHAAALQTAIGMGGNCTMLVVARHFDLPDGAIGFFEDSRQAIHNMSRIFRMTDADLEMLAEATMVEINYPAHDGTTDKDSLADVEYINKRAIMQLLRSLRAQYEAGMPAPEQQKVIA